jgi:hypothetical protein
VSAESGVHVDLVGRIWPHSGNLDLYFFMYLTDFCENTLEDVITKIETRLFKTVTGLTVKDFNLPVSLKVFNKEQMNAAIFAFRRTEDAFQRYTGTKSHEGQSHYGFWP